jgi:hypothetical protein
MSAEADASGTPEGGRRRGLRWVVAGGVIFVVLAGLAYFVFPGDGLRMEAALHRRADRFEHDAPPGLRLVRRYDEGMFVCPFECGSAYTMLVYWGPGLDDGQLCALGEAKLTELFGPPHVSRHGSGGCGGGWPLPGVYRDFASVGIAVVRAQSVDVSVDGTGSVLAVTFESGRA